MKKLVQRQHPKCGEKGNEVGYQEPLEGRFGLWGDSAKEGCGVGTSLPYRMWLGWAAASHAAALRGRKAFSLGQLDSAPGPWEGRRGSEGQVN